MWRSVLMTLIATVALPLAVRGQTPTVAGPGMLRYARGVTQALDLPELASATLPAGDREVRIWGIYGLSVMQRLLRITEHKGTVHGTLMLWWATDDSWSPAHRAWFDTTYGTRCTPVVQGMQRSACVLHFNRPIAWQKVLAQLDSLGIADLPGSDQLGADGYSVVVELREGPRYRTFEYWTPLAEHGPDEARAQVIGLLPGDLEDSTAGPR